MPRASVLITTFNRADLVREAIDSILAQTFTDFELVVVDDCSTDDTAGVLAGYLDPRVRVIRNRSNLGIAATRNVGWAACTGEFIALLDSDDRSHPERLARQVTYLESRPSAVAVATTHDMLIDGKVHPGEDRFPACGFTPALQRWVLLVGNPFTYSTMMVRRPPIGGKLQCFVDEEFACIDDWELYHRLATTGDIGIIRDPLTIYRIHAQNISSQESARFASENIRFLTNIYQRYLGEQSHNAAILTSTYLVRRQTARDGTHLNQLANFLNLLAREFCKQHATPDEDRQCIMEYARSEWWRVLLAAIRAGQPSFISHAGAAAKFDVQLGTSVTELLRAGAVGAVRSTRAGKALIETLQRTASA
jgi:glycosyltransferase involved in cell wall biosynthesis